MSEKKKVELTRLNVNIDKELKDEFIALCKELDSDATKEIRKFIKSFLKSYKKY